MIKVTKAASPPPALRQAYIESLAEPQELYLEEQVNAGKTLTIGDEAYGVILDRVLVEFFVAESSRRNIVVYLDHIMIKGDATRIRAKSFDSLLLYAALSKQATVATGGFLFRRILDETFMVQEQRVIRAAGDSDVEEVWRFNDDFFISRKEVQSYVARNSLFLLLEKGEVVGCGIGTRVIESKDDIDIGMLVKAAYRGRGFGTYIIRLLKRHYLSQGLRPICGCSIKNIASSKALSNAGFVSEHRILEITYSL